MVVSDSVIQTITSAVRNHTTTNQEEIADALLSISQNREFPITNSAVYENFTIVNSGTHYHIDEPMKYPVETVVMGGGECIDDSILYASLLKAAGIPRSIIISSDQTHAYVGVGLSSAPTHTGGAVSSYTDSGVTYYTAETTSWGFRVGQPSSGMTASAYVYPV
jgi:transglutaminase-like putative cysteine protease